jgi:general secretion pathway protein B
MSYILEALKRSQRERELGQVPTLRHVPQTDAPATTRAGPWIASALGLAAIAVGIALYALLEAQPQQPNPAEVAKAAVPPARTEVPPSVAPIPVTSPGPQPAEAAPASRRPSPPVRRPAASPAAKERPPAVAEPPAPPGIPADLVDEVRRFEQEVLRQAPSAEEGAETEADPEPPPSLPVGSPPPAAADTAAAVPSWRQLSPELRKRIPPQHLSVHVYAAEPAQRFVLLNSRKVREGDRTRDGLAVVEIRQDGVVLEFEGQRFSIARSR